MQIATPSFFGLTIFAGLYFFVQGMLDSQMPNGGKQIKPPGRQKTIKGGTKTVTKEKN